MNFVTDFLPILNIVLAIGLVIGGFFALRKGYSREAGEAQERLIDALEKEVASVRREVDDLKRERSTQDNVIKTIRYLLKSYGLRISITGDMVTVNDGSGQSKTTRVQHPASVKPIVTPDEDNDAG